MATLALVLIPLCIVAVVVADARDWFYWRAVNKAIDVAYDTKRDEEPSSAMAA